jgi:hypothetical protein
LFYALVREEKLFHRGDRILSTESRLANIIKPCRSFAALFEEVEEREERNKSQNNFFVCLSGSFNEHKLRETISHYPPRELLPSLLIDLASENFSAP